MIPVFARTLAAICAGFILAPACALAQGTPPTSGPTVNSPNVSGPTVSGKGAEVLAARCLQCHADGMWRDQRQNRRAWEATLYRMVARGAAWEAEEIKAMADYLGSDFGPSAPTAAAPQK